MSTPMPKRPSMHTIESSVTRLLVSTKHLLGSLTLWAQAKALEGDVSDAYVQLGNEFKIACKAFTNAGVDVSDLGDVPQSLRVVLEEALCEPPSQQSLDLFLPVIREIIITLLKNLKKKQEDVRTMSARRSVSGPPDMPIHARSSSTTSNQSNVIFTDPSALRMPPLVSDDETSTRDALEKLQNGDTLQRRASKRFSAYQYAKLTNYSPVNDPLLPKKMEKKFSALPEVPEESPRRPASPGNATIFMKVQHRTKKVNVHLPVTLASLRLTFVEKFAYSPGSELFPDIYIQDASGVSYELEELALDSVVDGTLVLLNEPDAGAAIARSVETQFAALKAEVAQANAALLQEIKSAVEEVRTQRETNERQAADIDAKPLASALAPASLKDLRAIGDIRRELAVLRQLNTTNKDIVKQAITGILTRLQTFQAAATTSKSSGRTYMEGCHAKLSQDSDELLTKVDDLQDVIEALRKDVVARGVRPSDKQLALVAKEMAGANADLSLMGAYILKEKARWKQIWEAELDTVCEEQQFFALQEDLMHDLVEDLAKALETFNLVEQCSDEQNKNPRIRSVANHLPVPEPGSMNLRRDALLSEVAALTPNHESRIEAIERAERMRQRDLELRAVDKFEEELGGFVENNMLKKSGGIEEIERLRRLKDEENLRNMGQPF
ncbi:hypothetical protein BABINDRAFT_163435 [Babjeviella inositovora NRRL Y-12698]|uniref:Actin interacting protein 3 C-terminal domain-containing protein n=1 Tax=Babjeviella inositovora NRRL Y-12698 TaxID=984486 RepID=A0A1E3QKW6_9ASCO|nr:uncharacterized protein BABINDRAFT_163435 [Babjeviella inositovora NRRL Y-12698]ODQ77732.1 hypothetical protein BABINDRAFT_163435 [Babjeviella inositovora NRRL Y-12698]